MNRRWVVRLGALGVALAGALTFGSAAYANTATTAELHQTNVVLKGSGFDTCDGLTSKPGVDQWVFIWPDDNNNNLGELVSLDLSFDGDADGDALDPGEHRTKADVIGLVGGPSSTLKVIIETPAGWTLLSGTSETLNPVSLKVGDTWLFNLTHGCSGTDGTPSPSPSGSESESGSPSPSGSDGGSGSETPSTGGGGSSSGGGDGGSLPVTGAALGGVLVTGFALIAGGVALMIGLRRRAATEAAAE